MKRGGEFSSSWLDSNYNKFAILSSRVMDNTSYYSLNGEVLREVSVKIRLEKIDMQERIMVEALLYSRVTSLVMSLKFIKK